MVLLRKWRRARTPGPKVYTGLVISGRNTIKVILASTKVYPKQGTKVYPVMKK